MYYSELTLDDFNEDYEDALAERNWQAKRESLRQSELRETGHDIDDDIDDSEEEES